MKKKILSLVLAVVMIAGLMAGMGITVNAAADYQAVFATAVDSATKSTAEYNGTNLYDWIWEKAKTEQKPRWNPENALGKYDAFQNGHDDRFTGLRYYDEVTYSFNDLENEKVRLIANYRGADEATKPDVSLAEVTWGTGWHIEAVEVYLVGAVSIIKENGMELLSEPSDEPLYIGTAFNKVGIDMGLHETTNHLKGFNVGFSKNGNFAFTDIYFPDEVAFAEAVQLRDVTADFNNPPSSSTYTSYDEGFDLDALTAWYTIIGGDLEGDFSLVKMVDYDGDGDADDFGIGFEFELYKYIDGLWVYEDTQYSIGEGIVAFKDLSTGSYKIVEVPTRGFTLTNYTEGLFINVIGQEVEILNGEDMAPEFLNRYTPGWSDSDTSWAGRVTNNKLFPMNNKSPFAEYDGAKRSGQSNWAMVMMVDGATASADIVMGQHTDIGDIVVARTAEGFKVTGTMAGPQYRVTHVHADASADLSRFTKAQGNGNFIVNTPVQLNDSGAFSFVIPYSHTEGRAYVGIHMESSVDLNYDLRG